MYNIDTSVDKPDKERLKARVEKMMSNGVKIRDISALKEQFNSTLESMKVEIREKYGIINPNSNKQIAEYLQYISNEVPIGEKNDIIDTCYIDDKWVCDKAVLNKLSLLGYEFADDMMFYRAAKKSAETVNSLSSAMDSNGLIHPEVHLSKTNRINYRNPGLMTVQKGLLRYVIGPRVEGDVLYSVDIKNQEPAILINAIGEEALIEALKSKEGLYDTLYKFVFKPCVKMNMMYNTFMEDRIYNVEEIRASRFVSPALYMPAKVPCMSWYINGKRIVATETICQGTSLTGEAGIEYPSEVRVQTSDGDVISVPVEWERVKAPSLDKDYVINGYLPTVEIRMSKQERKEFKTSFLAITYGSSSMGIEQGCKIIDGKLVYDRITKLPKMKEYREKCGKAAKQGRQSLYTTFGTLVSADKYGGTAELKRSLLSIPIQGTGADILDLLVNRFQKESVKKFKGDGISAFVYYTRHDELIIEVSKEAYEKFGDADIKQWLSDTLTHQIDNWVPFMVEVEQIEQGNIEELLIEEE